MLLENVKIYLSEIGLSMIKRTKQKKISAFAGRSAVSICQKENPSMYEKYKRYKELHMDYKKKIEQKYGKRALANARKKMR